jgi:hypothetical protein
MNMNRQFGAALPDAFRHSKYVVRRKILTLLGASFHVYDTVGQVVLFSHQKAFKLKEDIRVYTDEQKTTELLTIQARQVLDFSAAYDVIDATSGTKVGALRRRGWKSLLRDAWILLDPMDREIGSIVEDSAVLALIRRTLTNLIPQSYTVTVEGSVVAEFKQNFNPFLLKLTLDFQNDVSGRLDRRLGLAAAILLCAIEGRQN